MARRTYSLRPVVDDDQEFLRRVYAGTREEEFALVSWSADEKERFLRMQFDLQDKHYRTYYADAEFSVVVKAGDPIGRLYLDRRADEFRIVDITLLSACRGSGTATEIMHDILDEAATAGKPVRIHVAKRNRAVELYLRLGFEKIGDTGVYDFMERKPG